MLLSRFWYVVLGLVLGAMAFVLFLASGMYNRAAIRQMGEALAADTQVVASYLRDDSRRRSSALIPIALDEELRSSLAKSSNAASALPTDSKDKARAALRKQFEAVPADLRFDSLFAIDQHGRVLAQVGFDQASGIDGFELGGYPLVADALHGWIRDDAWVLGGRVFRAVGRPVENEAGAMPAGAIVGLRAVDDSFARELSRRTGAAVGFYTHTSRIASGAPEGFDPARLDTITNDLKNLDGDSSYEEKGTSEVRTIGNLGVVYAKLPGEAWDLGAGYAVGRQATLLASPLGFLDNADDKDKDGVPLLLIGGLALGAAFLGIFFSLVEHTQPLSAFRAQVQKLAKGDIEQLTPSQLRGAYRAMASDLNDGLEKVAVKGGAPKRAADLEEVLGPIPAQPAMSAFSLPTDLPTTPIPEPPPASPRPPAPSPVLAPTSKPTPTPTPAPTPDPTPTTAPPRAPAPPKPKPPKPAPPARPAPLPPKYSAPVDGLMMDDEVTAITNVPQQLLDAIGADATTDELGEWRKVFEDFVRIKKECGEPTEGATFEKFQVTLRKTRDSLMEKHACKKVKFSVYVKEGRAALRASPMKAG